MGCCGNSSVGVRWAARSAAAAAAQVGCIDGGVSGGNRCTAGAGGKHQELESQCQVASTSGGAAVAPTWGAFATIHTDVSAAAAPLGCTIRGFKMQAVVPKRLERLLLLEPFAS